jgi:hypothetical protein
VTSASASPSLDFVPKVRNGVHAVGNDQLLLYRDGELHLLSPTATVLWRVCDGRAAISELVDDLADEFRVERPVMESDIRTTVGTWVERGLLVDARVSDPADPTPPAELLTGPAGACSACDAAPDWVGQMLVRVGGYAVTVGVNDSGIAESLREVLAAHVVGEVPDGAAGMRPFFGVALEARVSSGIQPLHRLYRDGSVTMTGRTPGRIVRALAVELATLSALGETQLAWLPARAVVRDGHAYLLARTPNRVAFERDAERHGFAVVDGPAVIVDARTRELVVGTPGLGLDPRALDAVTAGVPTLGREPESVPWGRYPIAGLCVPGPATAAGAALTFAPRAGETPEPARALDAVAELLRSVPVRAASTPAELSSSTRG